MPNQFYKGRTNNHLTWVMVDATDFATPESALSAAMTIKVYGKLRGAAGVNFVSSGTGSLTNDIVHVGASATGTYSIGLVKADLSDASAAWYDQYVVVLAGTGAAQNVLVVDGGIDLSAISAYQSRLSDIASAVTVVQSLASDAHSAALLGASASSDAHSAALLIQSRLSDFDSRMVSDVSDIMSNIDAGGINASDMSDLRSAISAGPAATVTASDISDIASAVWAAKYTVHSAASSFGSLVSDIYSRVVLIQSLASDAHSAAILGASNASEAQSNALLIQSRLSDLDSRLTSDVSDIMSNIDAVTATISASDISDIASAVWAAKYTANSAASSFGSLVSDIYSRVVLIQSLASDAHSAAILGASNASEAQSNALLIQSRLSDLDSRLTSDVSDIMSNIDAVTATVSASDISDIASAVWAAKYTAHSLASSFGSLVSDIYSRVVVIQSTASDAHSAAVVAQSLASDAHSAALLAASAASDAHSAALLIQSNVSDVESQLDAGVSVLASSMSDIASRVWATAMVEPTTVVSVTGTMKAGVEWLMALSRNKITQTATVQSLRNDADAADIASAAVSDDGTVFTRAEWG